MPFMLVMHLTANRRRLCPSDGRPNGWAEESGPKKSDVEQINQCWFAISAIFSRSLPGPNADGHWVELNCRRIQIIVEFESLSDSVESLDSGGKPFDCIERTGLIEDDGCLMPFV